MHPRIKVLSYITPSLCFRPILNSNYPGFKVNVANKATLASKKKHYDPYMLAQIKLKKNANISRRKELKKKRIKEIGDPVRGIETPFLKSLDDVGGSIEFRSQMGVETKGQNENDVKLLNHFLTPSELDAAFDKSKFLSSPDIPKSLNGHVPIEFQENIKLHEERHQNAVEAIRRIVSLSNASSKDKTRANIVRCIQKFGRHYTDKFLKPRPPVHPSLVEGKNLPKKTPRAGPDTGSSEVQIAILTAKIRVLANNLEQHGGNKDKVNKRNLRLLVHRRQKLLNYLRRKERGGERWQHLVKTLGLTDGTWQGEISL